MDNKLSLDQDYWNSRYDTRSTGWDLGQVSPPLSAYIDQLENKNLKILIPGCGNSYEAEYLLANGFTDVSLIDIAPSLVAQLQEKFRGNKNIKIILGDFFEHQGSYDLILEQTFFCAIHPSLRKQYVTKMKSLLLPGGKLAGLLFDTHFEQGPPFGGSRDEYQVLFETDFDIRKMEVAHNSFAKRKGTELFCLFQAK